MLALFSLVVVITMSLLIVRIATVALTLTGISEQLARFQARSAFTGAGYTTNESEKIMQHPVRRRIIMTLMLLGNAGLVTAVSTLMLSFVKSPDTAAHWTDSLVFRGVLLVVALVALWFVAHSKWVDRWITRTIREALRRFTDLDVNDYAGLLHFGGGYTVSEIHIDEKDWLANRVLKDARLSDEGVLVLGVQRLDGSYIGAARGDTTILPDDTIVIYGRCETLADINRRQAGPEGTWAHFRSVHEQRRKEAEERAEDEAAMEKRKLREEMAKSDESDAQADDGKDDDGQNAESERAEDASADAPTDAPDESKP